MNHSIAFDSSQPVALYWGVDIASQSLELACHGESATRVFENNPPGIAQLVEWVSRRPIAVIVVEATGGYERALAVALAEAGLPVAVLNPRQLRSFATAVGQLAKTDPLDALAIAHYGAAMQPKPRPIPGKQQRLLDDLAARRRQLIRQRIAELNRRGHASCPEVSASIEAMLEAIQGQFDAIEAQMVKLIEQDESWRQRDQILQSVAGVGPATSHTLIAELPELGQLEHKKLAKLVGVAPLNRDSGKVRGKRLISGGRVTVRSALYMAAFNAARCNATIREFYLRLRAAGKSHNLALTACAHKLLTILNALVRDGVLWEKPAMTT